MTIEGTTDTEVFQTYVRVVLCPTLHPGDWVIMDNLSPHKNDATLQRIEQAGASVRFLPAYSPDLNPIEKMWSKVKELRSAEARTREGVQAAIAAVLACDKAQDAMNWFASCGYCLIEYPLAAFSGARVLASRLVSSLAPPTLFRRIDADHPADAEFVFQHSEAG